MVRRNPDLVVPIRDRRRRKRILTLKNVRNVTLIAVALFAALTIASEIRRPKTRDDYGRLFGSQIAVPATTAQSTPQVITEAPVADEEHADPLLLSAAAREQYLGVNSQPVVAPVVSATPADFARPAPVLGEGRHVSVVGDANGVAVVTEPAPRRETLGGGIFKP
jgi:hypothetical protein